MDEKIVQLEEIERMRRKLEDKQRELDEELQKKRDQLARIQQMKLKLETERDRSEQDFREKINQVRSLTEQLVESTKLVSSMAEENPAPAPEITNGTTDGQQQQQQQQQQQFIDELKLHCQQAREKIADLNESFEQQKQQLENDDDDDLDGRGGAGGGGTNGSGQ